MIRIIKYATVEVISPLLTFDFDSEKGLRSRSDVGSWVQCPFFADSVFLYFMMFKLGIIFRNHIF